MLSEKRLAKIEKALGQDKMIELERNSVDQMRDAIVDSEYAIREAINELEANPKYLELKESLKALSEGLREVKKRQNAIIQYCLSILEDRGNA